MVAKQRAGIGHDAHRLVAGRKLILGGVEIPYEKGLDGWSDADALTHAVMDALLGAAGMGDIGEHFPPGVAEYRGVSSMSLLEKVRAMLADHGWVASNIDATILAERPRLGPMKELMRKNISDALGLELSAVSIKAGTSEGMGFVGRGEGIEVLAIAMIDSREG